VTTMGLPWARRGSARAAPSSVDIDAGNWGKREIFLDSGEVAY
jgi:hypothetical protein